MMKVRISEAYGAKEVHLYRTEQLDDVASLAIHFLARWSLVAAVEDGEDSAGRQKLRLPSADEVVTRAFDIAEKSFQVARARGHMVTLPDLNEINAENDRLRAERTAAKRAEQSA